MNKTQIKQLQKIDAELSSIVERIEEIQNNMQDTFDNKSESWQEGEQGEAMEETIDNLDNAAGDAISAGDYIRDIVNAEH